jgi:hypothetical protein
MSENFVGQQGRHNLPKEVGNCCHGFLSFYQVVRREVPFFSLICASVAWIIVNGVDFRGILEVHPELEVVVDYP